jgi:hypothetical protein
MLLPGIAQSKDSQSVANGVTGQLRGLRIVERFVFYSNILLGGKGYDIVTRSQPAGIKYLCIG